MTGWCNGRWGQVDDSLAVDSGTGNADRRALADEKTIAGTAHILLACRGILHWLVMKHFKVTILVGECIGKFRQPTGHFHFFLSSYKYKFANNL